MLVERVEGFAAQADWMRAFEEINAFEDQLRRHGTIVSKFWLQISQEEQLRRFEARAETAFKRFKITEDDLAMTLEMAKCKPPSLRYAGPSSTEEIPGPWCRGTCSRPVVITRTLVERLQDAGG